MLLKITFEKHAPMCTLGVGGRPLLGGRGGVCLLRCFLGGTGGQATKSGALKSWLRLCLESEPTENPNISNFITLNALDLASPLLLVLSALELSLSDLWRWPLMFMELTNPKISSTEECLRGEPFKAKSSTGLVTAWISHFVSESCTGNVALKQGQTCNFSEAYVTLIIKPFDLKDTEFFDSLLNNLLDCQKVQLR